MTDSTDPQDEVEAAIMYLKDRITKEWRVLADKLNVQGSEIYSIAYSHKENPKEKTREMLITWLERNGPEATILDLTDALQQAGRRDLANDLSKGKHLAYVSKFRDVDSSVVKENNRVRNQKIRKADQHTDRKWYLIIACIVGPVLGAYLIYHVVTQKHMTNNGGSTDTKAAYNFELNAGNDGVFSASPKRTERSSEWDTTKKSKHELLQPDHLENAARYLKNTLTKEWQDVGRYLGLSHPDIEHINEQQNNNPKERNYQMLQKWREQYGNQASVEALEDALRKAGRGDLADNLYKEIRNQETR